MLSAVLSVVGLVINELMAANVGIKVLWIGSNNIRGDQAPPQVHHQQNHY